MATYTYQRWFPPNVVGDGTAVAPAFVLAVSNSCWREEKRQEQTELRAWESEGGNPEPRSVTVQASLSQPLDKNDR